MEKICHCENGKDVHFINMQTCMCCRIKQKDLLYYRLSFPVIDSSIQKSRMIENICNEEFVYCYKCASYIYIRITERMINNRLVPLSDRNYDILSRYPCEIPRSDGSYTYGHIIASRANPLIYTDLGICVYVAFASDGKVFKKYTSLLNLIKCNPCLKKYWIENRLTMNLEYEYVVTRNPQYTFVIRQNIHEILDALCL